VIQVSYVSLHIIRARSSAFNVEALAPSLFAVKVGAEVALFVVVEARREAALGAGLSALAGMCVIPFVLVNLVFVVAHDFPFLRRVRTAPLCYFVYSNILCYNINGRNGGGVYNFYTEWVCIVFIQRSV
jgi:hypothetical protein